MHINHQHLILLKAPSHEKSSTLIDFISCTLHYSEKCAWFTILEQQCLYIKPQAWRDTSNNVSTHRTGHITLTGRHQGYWTGRSRINISSNKKEHGITCCFCLFASSPIPTERNTDQFCILHYIPLFRELLLDQKEQPGCTRMKYT